MFLNGKRVLLLKEESVYGNDPTPTVSSNAIAATNIKVNYRGDVQERNTVRDTLSPVAAVMGKRWIEVSFDIELKGSGSKGVAAAIGDILEACGMAETVSVGSSVTYRPSSSVMKSSTIYVYDLQDSGSARLHKCTGARCASAKMNIEAGKIATATLTFRGLYNAATDAAAPSTPTYESSKPPIVQSSTFSWNGVTSLVIQKLEIDLGLTTTDSDDINSSGSIKSINIVGRKPTGTFTPEAVLAATVDWRADMVAGTERALSVVIGTVDGNKITISAPKCTIDSVNDTDRNGVLADELPFRMAQSSGNDELVLTFA